jgi:hypothetical protein
MTAHIGRQLADLLAAWKLDRRVSYAHIARHGKVSLNTLRYLFAGSRHIPERETLHKVAVGLATEWSAPYHLDDDLLTRIEREVFAIAGYTPLDDETARGLLERALLATGQSVSRARRLAGLLRACAELDDAAIEQITASAARHRREDPATE